MTAPSRIAIVGAGPGGLVTARILALHGIEVSVYDADASVDARQQGGTLDLHADGGQLALEDAGLLSEFFQLARPEGQNKTMRDPRGQAVVEHIASPEENAAPEIDRGQLRAMLAAAVDPACLHWGHRLERVTDVGDGAHRLHFAHGGTREVDLVIGADGAWSRVRPLVTDAQPHYTGVTFLEVRFDDADTAHPGIAALVGDGHMFANGDGRALILQRNSNGQVRGYVGLRCDPDRRAELRTARADPDTIRRLLLQEFNGWAEDLLAVITDSDGGYRDWPLYALPAPLSWPHTRGVTLLGDAAHLMAPFGGDGANLALLDGAELARAIITQPDVDTAIARYEATMLPRAGATAPGANRALAEFFARGEFAVEDIPDFEAEAAGYHARAAAYREAGSRR